MTNIILCGAPGSGKGTQSELLAKKYHLLHFSTGDALRAEIKSGSALGKEIEAIISKGNLVPDVKMIALIENFFDNLPTNCKGVILDGFPRTVEQAKALTEMMHNRNLSAILIELLVEENELVNRMLFRGQTSGRADDTPEVIQQRLKVYHEQTAPVSTYYLKQGNYFAVNGMGEIEDTFRQLDKIVGFHI